MERNSKKRTDFLNGLDESAHIKFTFELESEGCLPFVDLLLVTKEDGMVKVQVYRKPTHTDQYLNVCSHHPVDHKLSVVRTLLYRSQSLILEKDAKATV